MKRWMLLLLVVGALIFAGCVDYQEEMTLNADGSGIMTVLVGMDMSMFSMFEDMEEDGLEDDADDEGGLEFSEDFADVEGVEILEEESYRDGDWEWSRVVIAFDSLEALAESQGDDGDLGVITWSQGPDGRWYFERELPIMGAEDDEELDQEALNMMAGFLGDSSFTYSVVFPGAVLEANTDEELIEFAESRVTWTFPQIDLMRESVTLRAVIQP